MSLTKNGSVYRLNKTEPVKALRTSRKFQITHYNKLVVPVSMRSIYWQYFGFPANNDGEIISKTRIVCVICRGQIAYNRNTSNLRMHLQNKHMTELSAIESQATPKTCKTRLRREDPNIDEHFVAAPDDSIREYYSVGSASEVVNLEVDSDDGTYLDESTTASSVKKRPARNTETESNLLRVITSFMILDLERPEVVLGKGFHRIVLNIENPASLPNVPIIVDEILPKKYTQVKHKLMTEINMVPGPMGLTLEEWQCVDGRLYASVCVYFQADNIVVCKMLATFSFLNEMDAHMWEGILTGLLDEWGISFERVTAAVCSMERDPIIEAFEALGIAVVPCLDYSIKESVRQCFMDEIIKDIISKIRRQMVLFKNCPLMANQVAEAMREEELPSLFLDVEAVWLSTLEMLEVAHKWRNASAKIIESSTYSTIESLIAINESEWDIIGDLIEALQPLKMTLMSISEEKVPHLSLIRPMLWQIIENKMCTTGEHSDILGNLKKAIIGILNYRYGVDKIANILNLATVADPRFKILPDIGEEEKTKVGELVHSTIKDVVVQTADSDKDGDKNRRLSNISMLLGELKRKKEKDATGAAMWEYQNYLSHENIGLENDPVQWWAKNIDKYPRVGHLADKYFCVPAVTTLPGKRTAEGYFNFHIKRSTLSPDVVNQLLFLNVNSIG